MKYNQTRLTIGGGEGEESSSRRLRGTGKGRGAVTGGLGEWVRGGEQYQAVRGKCSYPP